MDRDFGGHEGKKKKCRLMVVLSSPISQNLLHINGSSLRTWPFFWIIKTCNGFGLLQIKRIKINGSNEAHIPKNRSIVLLFSQIY